MRQHEKEEMERQRNSSNSRGNSCGLFLHSFLLFLFERANLVLDIILHLAEIEMAIL